MVDRALFKFLMKSFIFCRLLIPIGHHALTNRLAPALPKQALVGEPLHILADEQAWGRPALVQSRVCSAKVALPLVLPVSGSASEERNPSLISSSQQCGQPTGQAVTGRPRSHICRAH